MPEFQRATPVLPATLPSLMLLDVDTPWKTVMVSPVVYGGGRGKRGKCGDDLEGVFWW